MDSAASDSDSSTDRESLDAGVDEKLSQALLAIKSKDAAAVNSCKRELLTLREREAKKKRRTKYTLRSQFLDDLTKCEAKPTPLQIEPTSPQTACDSSDEDILQEVEDSREQPMAESKASCLMAKYFGGTTSTPDARTEFLKNYFVGELWNKKPTPGITVSELIIEGAAEEAESTAADEVLCSAYHFQEKGGDQVIGASRIIDSLVSQAKPSSRSIKRKEQKKRRREEVSQAIEKELKKASGLRLAPDNLERCIKEDQMNGIDDKHEWFLCDGCEKPIAPTKTVYTCAECDDFCLCKSCQKVTSHSHSLKKCRVPPGMTIPKSWQGVVAERQSVDSESLAPLAAAALRKLTKKPSGFKYLEVDPIDFGLTDEELLQIDEAKLNELAPMAALETYGDNQKAARLVLKGTQKIIRFRQQNKAPTN